MISVNLINLMTQRPFVLDDNIMNNERLESLAIYDPNDPW
jgi:hypothetical protein